MLGTSSSLFCLSSIICDLFPEMLQYMYLYILDFQTYDVTPYVINGYFDATPCPLHSGKLIF